MRRPVQGTAAKVRHSSEIQQREAAMTTTEDGNRRKGQTSCAERPDRYGECLGVAEIGTELPG